MGYTLDEFRTDYRDSNACLDKLFQIRFGDIQKCPKCYESANFKRVAGRKCYQCQKSGCQYQLYPMAATIFEKTTIPLIKWFQALFLIIASKNRTSIKEIERICGVSYPTALRMCRRLKLLTSISANSKMLTINIFKNELQLKELIIKD